MGLADVEMILIGYNTPIHYYPDPSQDSLAGFHSRLVMQAGAYQNGTFVVGVAKGGLEEGVESLAQSCIIGPSGEMLAQATTDGPVGPCIADGVNLCLGGGRFRVSARWTDGRGVSDTARARAITGDTGYLWFFSPANVELAVKVLEGCPSNGHYWVFSTGLTNVAVVLQALDTVTGKARTYVNPLRTPYRPVLDNEAFDTCP